MRTLNKTFWAALLLAMAGVSSAMAQQPDQGQQQPPPPDQSSAPIPAYHSPLASEAGNDDVTESQTIAPDNRSLTGAQYLSLGVPTTRSYWQPRLDIFVSADSNPNETGTGTGSGSGSGNGSGWGTWFSVSGGVDVHRISGNSSLMLSDVSGGTLGDNGGSSGGFMEGLSVADTLAFHRASITFVDQLEYLPSSAFGPGGAGGVGLSGGGTLGGGGSVFDPGQSVLLGRGQNLGNTFTTDVDTYLTPRTSLTFIGGYSLEHYFDSHLLDYGDMIFRGGYNYQMTRKDTIAVSYTFSGYRYGNVHQSIDDHTMQVSYARRVTGRLSFQIAAGPQFVFAQSPISVSGGGTTPGSISQVYWSLSTALQWQAGRNLLGFSYNHGVGGGAGVLPGSVADRFTGSVTRQVSRTFSSGISTGYDRNQGTAIGATTSSNQTYDYWFVGGNLSHPIGRSLGLSLSYQLQYQNSNAAFCIGLTCGTSFTRNLISVGLGWHDRPLLF